MRLAAVGRQEIKRAAVAGDETVEAGPDEY
jgi:hypothetical protein